MRSIGKITLTYDLWEDGDIVTGFTVEGDIPVIAQLGMLRMAEDTILRGEWHE